MIIYEILKVIDWVIDPLHWWIWASVIGLMVFIFTIGREKTSRMRKIYRTMVIVFLVLTLGWFLWTMPLAPPLNLDIPGGLPDEYVSFWVSIAAGFFGLNLVSAVLIVGLMARK